MPAASAAAATSSFKILLDLDNHQNTGCDVTTLTGPFKGVEQILITTVTSGGPVTQVTAVQVRNCNSVSGMFNAPVAVPAPPGHPLPWPIGVGNGTSTVPPRPTGSFDVIETYLPLSLVTVNPLHIVQVGVLGFDSNGVLRDEMVKAQPTPGNGPPILLNAGVALADIPTLSEWGLLLLGLLLVMAAIAVLRRRRTAAAFVLALLLLGSAGLAWGAAVTCDLNGTTLTEWIGGSFLASEPGLDTPPAPIGSDVQALYGFRDGTLNALSFRIDAELFAPVFNQPPAASDDAATVVEDSGANPVNVLANDSDPEGDPLSIQSVTQPANGMVVITGGGTGLTYTPNANYCNTPPGTAPDTFTYTLAPGSPATTTATVRMTVNCLSSAVNDAYNAVTNTTLNVSAATGVTSNDTLNGGSIVSYGATTGGEQATIGAATPTSAGGSVTLNADGSFNYNPLTDFFGTDTFKYILQNAGGTSTATVTLTVSKATQTISFTSTAPASATVGGPTYNVTATATSGLPVALTIDPSASAVCSISGSTVSFIGVGTCVIDANQAGDVNYSPAPQVQQSFAVGQGSQTITFTSTAPAGCDGGRSRPTT